MRWPMPEKAFNAADTAQVNARKRTAKESADRNQADLRTLLKQPEFRRYIWRHMNETCGLLRSASNPNGSVQSTNLGMQDVARVLWAEIEAADAMAIPAIMVEYHESQK